MKMTKIFCLFVTLFLFPFSGNTLDAFADESQEKMDTTYLNKMIRFGIQAQERKKYLEAKEYFRKALQTDPSSDMAWRYYDMAVVFALAENVKKNKNLTAPTVIEPEVAEAVDNEESISIPIPVQTPSEQKDTKPAIEFKIVDDEDGCY